MFSLDELNRPVAVGLVGHPFTPSPVGAHAMVSDDKRMDRRDDSPVGSTGILDPVNKTGSPIQSDFRKAQLTGRRARATLPHRVIQVCTVWKNSGKI